MKIKFPWITVIILSFVLSANNSLGQTQTEDTTKVDSGKTKAKGLLAKIQDFSRKSARESLEDFKSDKVAMVQLEVINKIRLTIQEAKGFLKTGIDTAAIKKKMAKLKEDYHTASDGVFINVGTTQTYRNLASTKRVLRELSLDAKKVKNLLEIKQKGLAGFHFKIDSLSIAPELFIFPKDSALTVDYFRTLAAVATEAAPVDSVLKNANIKVQKLLNSYNLTISELQNALEQVETFERQMANESMTREVPNIWQEQLHFRPFMDIVKFSLEKNILTFYRG